MITKERLIDLIKRDATIYTRNRDIELWSRCSVLENFKVNNCSEPNDYLLLKYLNCVEYFAIEDLYEDKEEIEFIRKYQNITRTERLSLPTWKEMTSKDSIYRHCGGWKFDFGEYRLGVYLPQYEGDREMIIVDKPCFNVYSQLIFFKFNKVTKENYLKACEICRKLFLGEKVEEVK